MRKNERAPIVLRELRKLAVRVAKLNAVHDEKINAISAERAALTAELESAWRLPGLRVGQS